MRVVKQVGVISMQALHLASSGCMQEFSDYCSPSWAGGDPPPRPELPSVKMGNCHNALTHLCRQSFNLQPLIIFLIVDVCLHYQEFCVSNYLSLKFYFNIFFVNKQ